MCRVRRMVLGGIGCLMLFGCVSPSMQSERIDVVYNPELVKNCTLKSEGRYTALGEKNALTMAKNATAERGGNVLLVVAINRADPVTTDVQGKIYTCEARR